MHDKAGAGLARLFLAASTRMQLVSDIAFRMFYRGKEGGVFGIFGARV